MMLKSAKTQRTIHFIRWVKPSRDNYDSFVPFVPYPLFLDDDTRAGPRARSRKINYISKVKIEFGWRGAFVFARRRSPSPSLSAAPYSRNGRNFKRKFTNEGDFPRTPPRPAHPAGRGRDEGRAGGEEKATKRKIARRFSATVFRASSSTHRPRLSRSFDSFFFYLFTCTRERLRRTAAAKNEILRSQQKFTFPYAAIVIALEVSAKCAGCRGQILKLPAC